MKALIIGGATIDVITSIDTENIECITMSNATNSYLMMEQGKKVEARHIDNQVGGGATNAAVAVSRLGSEVFCLLKLGGDLEAERILTRLKNENIDTQFVKCVESQQTGKSIIIASHNRNAGIFVHRGANTTLSVDDLDEQAFQDVGLVYVSTLSGASADLFLHIAKMAKQAGAFVACNPGIRQIRNRKEQLLKAMQYVDLLAINETEAAALAEGMACGSEIVIRSEAPQLIANNFGDKDAPVSLHQLADSIHDKGCMHLVVTNGSEGAYLATAEAIHFCPAVSCDVETTIGAGDAFNATLAFSLSSNQNIYNALNMAVSNAASAASVMDAQSGLMSIDDLTKCVDAMDRSRVQTFPY